MVQDSLKVEFLSLSLCVGLGVIIGATCFALRLDDDWPTAEMKSRGDVEGLLTGIAIAIPSGAGVALSTLGNNTSSLVGVAISASLLPPAVNAGICLIIALLLQTGERSSLHSWTQSEWLECGLISFSLTVVNIVSIWASGLLMFKIKEIAPTTNASWLTEVEAARHSEKVVSGEEAKALQEDLRKAMNVHPGDSPSYGSTDEGGDGLMSLFNREKDEAIERNSSNNSLRFQGLEGMSTLFANSKESLSP